MKYYLIIGYQLLEKYKQLPTVRVRLNGQLVDEFLCDNEQTTEILVQSRFSKNMSGTCHNWKWDSIETSRYMAPAKYKMIELDTKLWPDKGELTIEVSNNNSNYNNGFMTLRSIVWITPVFLIRKDIFDNMSLLHRIVKKVRQMRTKVKGKDFYQQLRATWPGISTYPDRDKELFQSELHRGGNFNLHFEIRKKHKAYMLVGRGQQTKGYFQIDLFFLAWYEHHSKNYFELITENNIDIDGQV